MSLRPPGGFRKPTSPKPVKVVVVDVVPHPSARSLLQNTEGPPLDWLRKPPRQWVTPGGFLHGEENPSDTAGTPWVPSSPPPGRLHTPRSRTGVWFQEVGVTRVGEVAEGAYSAAITSLG